MTEENSKSHWRKEFWDALDDYEKDIISICHRPGGDVLQDRIAKAKPKNKVVADIGCGTGNFLPALKGAKKIYAVDFSANMLEKAKVQAPGHSIFLQQDLRQLALPEKVDLAICFNAMMPENHTEALTIFGNVLNAVKTGGTLLLVLPSLECRLYGINMTHFNSAREGKEREHLVERMATFTEHFNNPLGYIKDRHDVVTRHWLESEIKALISQLRPAKSLTTFKVDILWQDIGYDPAQWQDGIQSPWFWGVKVRF